MQIEDIINKAHEIKTDYQQNKHRDTQYETDEADRFNEQKLTLFTEVLQAIANGHLDAVALAGAALTIDQT